MLTIRHFGAVKLWSKIPICTKAIAIPTIHTRQASSKSTQRRSLWLSYLKGDLVINQKIPLKENQQRATKAQLRIIERMLDNAISKVKSRIASIVWPQSMAEMFTPKVLESIENMIDKNQASAEDSFKRLQETQRWANNRVYLSQSAAVQAYEDTQILKKRMLSVNYASQLQHVEEHLKSKISSILEATLFGIQHQVDIRNETGVDTFLVDEFVRDRQRGLDIRLLEIIAQSGNWNGVLILVNTFPLQTTCSDELMIKALEKFPVAVITAVLNLNPNALKQVWDFFLRVDPSMISSSTFDSCVNFMLFEYGSVIKDWYSGGEELFKTIAKLDRPNILERTLDLFPFTTLNKKVYEYVCKVLYINDNFKLLHRVMAQHSFSLKWLELFINHSPLPTSASTSKKASARKSSTKSSRSDAYLKLVKSTWNHGAQEFSIQLAHKIPLEHFKSIATQIFELWSCTAQSSLPSLKASVHSNITALSSSSGVSFTIPFQHPDDELKSRRKIAEYNSLVQDPFIIASTNPFSKWSLDTANLFVLISQLPEYANSLEFTTGLYFPSLLLASRILIFKHEKDESKRTLQFGTIISESHKLVLNWIQRRQSILPSSIQSLSESLSLISLFLDSQGKSSTARSILFVIKESQLPGAAELERQLIPVTESTPSDLHAIEESLKHVTSPHPILYENMILIVRDYIQNHAFMHLKTAKNMQAIFHAWHVLQVIWNQTLFNQSASIPWIPSADALVLYCNIAATAGAPPATILSAMSFAISQKRILPLNLLPLSYICNELVKNKSYKLLVALIRQQKTPEASTLPWDFLQSSAHLIMKTLGYAYDYHNAITIYDMLISQPSVPVPINRLGRSLIESFSFYPKKLQHFDSVEHLLKHTIQVHAYSEVTYCLAIEIAAACKDFQAVRKWLDLGLAAAQHTNSDPHTIGLVALSALPNAPTFAFEGGKIYNRCIQPDVTTSSRLHAVKQHLTIIADKLPPKSRYFRIEL